MENIMLEKVREQIKETEESLATHGDYQLGQSIQTHKEKLVRLKKTESILSNPATASSIEQSKDDIVKVMAKFNQITAKEKCLRVQMLDWLSDKLLDWSHKLESWSNHVHAVAANIDSPCLIEVTPRKKEESKSAIESKKIQKLKEQALVKEQALEEIKKENDKMQQELKKLIEAEVERMTK